MSRSIESGGQVWLAAAAASPCLAYSPSLHGIQSCPRSVLRMPLRALMCQSYQQPLPPWSPPRRCCPCRTACCTSCSSPVWPWRLMPRVRASCCSSKVLCWGLLFCAGCAAGPSPAWPWRLPPRGRAGCCPGLLSCSASLGVRAHYMNGLACQHLPGGPSHRTSWPPAGLCPLQTTPTACCACCAATSGGSGLMLPWARRVSPAAGCVCCLAAAWLLLGAAGRARPALQHWVLRLCARNGEGAACWFLIDWHLTSPQQCPCCRSAARPGGHAAPAGRCRQAGGRRPQRCAGQLHVLLLARPLGCSAAPNQSQVHRSRMPALFLCSKQPSMPPLPADVTGVKLLGAMKEGREWAIRARVRTAATRKIESLCLPTNLLSSHCWRGKAGPIRTCSVPR